MRYSKLKTPDLMVLDGDSKIALGVVRSLAAKGISIALGSGEKSSAAYSRIPMHKFCYDRSSTSLINSHKVIISYIESLRPKVLMPLMRKGWSLIFEHYIEYENLTKIVPNPGKELFERLRDKNIMADLCQQFSIPMPTTLRPKNIDEALFYRNQLSYPVLLKPRFGIGGIGIKRVNTKNEFERSIREFSEMPIIQELIEGEDLEMTILCIHGQTIAVSIYKSLRNFPLPYGPPVACKSIEDDALMSIGRKFLKNLQYNGVAHLDFRKDRRDGQAKLLDFNPRFAGTNDTSLHSGVDFGYLLYKLALDQHIDPILKYKTGKEFRMIIDELKYLKNSPHKAKTLRELVNFKNVSTDFSFIDPKPHLIWFGKEIRRIFKKIIGKFLVP